MGGVGGEGGERIPHIEMISQPEGITLLAQTLPRLIEMIPDSFFFFLFSLHLSIS